MKNLIWIVLVFLFSCNNQAQKYVCPPCGLACDSLTFETSGTCSKCAMELIKESELQKEVLILNDIDIKKGSGKFLIEGGKSNKNKSITVFYYKPVNFNRKSRVLIVLPGAGRNADSYRDAWIQAAEKRNVLILSPEYKESDYPFEDYHLCGIIHDLNLGESLEFIENSNIVKIDEKQLAYIINSKQDEWIFEDFDRIFDLSLTAIESNQKKYDIFGHSAGGQILHRYALFGKSSKVDKILAANSGFYTLANFESKLPFGLKNSTLGEQDLPTAFRKKLVVLVGQLDNQTEARGTLLRSSTVDRQGLHRLERAQYFFNQAKAIADEKQFDFNWKIEIIPNVGHDHRKMAEAAAHLLYSGNN